MFTNQMTIVDILICYISTALDYVYSLACLKDHQLIPSYQNQFIVIDIAVY
jgi:hypothetical protein